MDARQVRSFLAGDVHGVENIHVGGGAADDAAGGDGDGDEGRRGGPGDGEGAGPIDGVDVVPTAPPQWLLVTNPCLTSARTETHTLDPPYDRDGMIWAK